MYGAKWTQNEQFTDGNVFNEILKFAIRQAGEIGKVETLSSRLLSKN
jgi:hypothetical protein